MSKELSWIGKRLTQPDAVAKVTGAAIYAGDLRMPGMLIGRVLRSPYSHAKVKRIDKSKAERLPGVEVVITPADVAQWNSFDRGFKDLPMMPGKYVQPADESILNAKARHFGDAVAAVAAKNESIAEQALELIEVEYEKLPSVFEPKEAMKPGAPRVHDLFEGNVGRHMPYPFPAGDVDKAFREADCVIEGTFRTTRQDQCPMEATASVAWVDGNGRLRIWSQCQLPHLARRELAHIFNMKVGMVQVINPFVGGSFGKRISLCGEAICAALAFKAGKPVKLIYGKDEDFISLETRTAFRYDTKMGFMKDGTLTAIEIHMLGDCGGYVARSPLAAVIAMAFGMGHYRCPNRAGEAYMVLTNSPPGGAMRGFGNPEIMWGVEQLVDTAAEKLGMDPLELRLKNIKKTGEPSYVGLPIDSTYLEECIRIGAERIGWKQKWGRKKAGHIRRGVGMATMTHSSGAAPLYLDHSNAFIKVNEDGSINLTVHPGSPGTHILGALSQIAAEELGIHIEDVHVVTGDTDVTLFDIGSHASRSAYVIGSAVKLAAQQVKSQILERATKILGASPPQLDIRDRWVYVREAPEKRVPFAQVVSGAIYNFEGECLNISGKGTWESKYASPPTGAFFAEVEVNTQTGRVKVIKLITVMDCGKAINPMTVEGQLEGGIQQGLGFALTEDFVINKESGVVDTDNFDTYKIPGILDIPQTEVILIDRPDPQGPFGAKAAGEPTAVGVAPAIANAIYDAVGVRIKELPITPEKILKALNEKSR